MPDMNLILRAREAKIAAINKVGSAAALARAIDVSRSAITHWDLIPAERVQAVSAVTGIPAAQLRPDLAATFGVLPAVSTVEPEMVSPPATPMDEETMDRDLEAAFPAARRVPCMGQIIIMVVCGGMWPAVWVGGKAVAAVLR